MTTASGRSLAELRTAFDDACEISRSIVSDAHTLDSLAQVEDHGRHVSLRWILVHMIEESARHCGHADFIAQSIDGRVGD